MDTVGKKPKMDTLIDERLLDDITKLSESGADTSRMPPPELVRWLLAQLAARTEEHEVLPIWCKFWATQIGSASTYTTTEIRRSLFAQSLQRLIRTWTDFAALQVAYTV